MSVWRSHRAQDLAIGLAVAGIMVLNICLTEDRSGPLAANLAVLPFAGLGLALRRSRPLAPALVLLVVFSVGTAAGLTAAQDLSTALLPLLLASYAVGRYVPDPRHAVPIGLALIVVINLGGGRNTADDWVFPFMMMGAAGLAGRALRTRALVAAELAERTERLAVEQDLLAAEAAVEERRRIARELHDVVAHTLSVMVVQAGAARRTLDRDAGLALEALETVEATGRSALGELRRLLGFVGEAPAHAPLEPAPTLADLPALARRAHDAGLPTTFFQDGAPHAGGGLPAGAEAAVYRIAQEALTNAIKHAGPGATATMSLSFAPSELILEVRDAGGGGEARPDTALPSGGHGLVGMRERVALYGGELDAGAVADGGFRVVARLPLHGAAVPA